MLAEAGLKFYCGQHEQAFALLADFYQVIKTEMANVMAPYLAYTMAMAKQYHRPQLELSYLRESMVYSLFMSAQQLERFFELVPEDGRSAVIDGIITDMKTVSAEHALDKIAMLLLRDGRADTLVKELKFYKNKFALVHKIALQKVPLVGPDFLALYAKHLGDALTDPSYAQYHEQIFSTAKKFLDRLPAAKAQALVEKVLDRLGAYSHIHRFIRKLFPEK